MSTGSVVTFRTGAGAFAVAVEHVREVRTTSGIRPIPAPGPDVVGFLPDGDATLTVVSALGSGRGQVLVLEPDGQAFGVLVEEVSGVIAVEDEQIGPRPAGQTGALVSGVVRGRAEVVLVVDARALARALDLSGPPE